MKYTMNSEEVLYTMAHGRLRLRELWRFSKGNLVTFLLAVSFKIRNKRNYSLAVRRRSTVTIIDWVDLHDNISKPLADAVSECSALDCVEKFIYRATSLKAPNSVLQSGSAVLLHRHLPIKVIIACASANNRPAIPAVAFKTMLNDGRVLATTTTYSHYDPHPKYIIERSNASSLKQILDRHTKRLEAFNSIKSMPETNEEIQALIEQDATEFIEYMIARGVYVPMTKSEMTFFNGHGT